MRKRTNGASRRSSRSSAATPARMAALAVLIEAEQRDAYTREVLKTARSRWNLDARDDAFAQRLALGVTATVGCLDDLLAQHLDKPGKVSPRVRMALRLAVFELLYLSTPTEVAVSQGVELVRSQASAAASLANAVLRRVALAAPGFLAASDAAADQRGIVQEARGAGLPVWLARSIVASIGEDRMRLLCTAQLDPAPIAFHVHPGCEDPRIAMDSIERFPGCIVPSHPSSLLRSGLLDDASLVVSDEHAQLVATLATRAGSCLEIGAGRGTKTFVMACQALRAGFGGRHHVAVDLFEGKCSQNLARFAAAGFSGIEAYAGDATDLDIVLRPLDERAGATVRFDTVLVDAPCSGTGTMRRHPEIPWRLTRRDVEHELPSLQLQLLRAAARRVDAGGELVYATCSVLRSENVEVVEAFLSSEEGSGFSLASVADVQMLHQPGFEDALARVRSLAGEDGFLQSIPCAGAADGHFCARLVRCS